MHTPTYIPRESQIALSPLSAVLKFLPSVRLDGLSPPDFSHIEPTRSYQNSPDNGNYNKTVVVVTTMEALYNFHKKPLFPLILCVV